jgi:putative ABC transport system permease protein
VKVALSLALRDLRGGLGALRLLALCLFLGVLALAGIGSLGAAMGSAIAERGAEMLGGDVQLIVSGRAASAEELAAFRREGRVGRVVRTRAMGSRPDGGDGVLVELKGVDSAWPLVGRFRVQPGALSARPGGNGVALAPEAAERLGLRIGDPVRIGMAEMRLTALIAEEPDRIGQGFTLGSTALVDEAALAATGTVEPGSLFTSAYRLKLAEGASAKAAAARLKRQWGPAGWQVQDRTNGAPGTRRFVERLAQFLTLVGLAALVIAGIGVGNGVSAYLDSKRASMATLKLLGATGRTLFLAYFAQVAIVALAATVAGLAAGALVPAAVLAAAGDALPVAPRLSLYPLPLVSAAAYGLLIALAFSIVPLARARLVPPGSLFRSHVEALRRPGWLAFAAAAGAAGLVALLAVATAGAPSFAAGFIAAVLVLALLLTLFGALVRWASSRLPRPRGPVLRLALSNLHRPGAQTARLVVALGLGLTLFTALAVVETNLSGQIRTAIPKKAPSYFLLDIPAEEIGRFRTVAAAAAPRADVTAIPSLRGSVVAVGGRRVAEMGELPPGAWFLRGDRGLTYSATLPEGSRIVSGRWWPADYAGPPLVSLDVEAARSVGLKVGDPIVVAVLGREIEARIASLREIHWDTMGFNFVIVFAPGALESAPHSFMATAVMPEAQERGFARALAAAFPTVSAIRVKDVVQTVSTMLGQVTAAVRAAASVAIFAGIAVLVGALAASRRARVYDAVVLKMLGATRGRLLAAQAAEFGALALLVGAVALGLGSAGGWWVVTGLLELDWAPDWAAVGLTLGAGAFATLALGLLGSLPALAARPARALRSL